MKRHMMVLSISALGLSLAALAANRAFTRGEVQQRAADLYIEVQQGGGTADLYIKDTPLDTGIEPNPDTGPMWVSEDIWVRKTPDPNYKPYPFPEAAPPWTPLPNENPEYRDPKYSVPNYVYVRVRNRGGAPSSGTERLRLYWAKASTGLSWSTQWVDYLASNCGPTKLYGAEITKPRKNAATASAAERDAYRNAILSAGTLPAFVFPDGIRYWHKQQQVHVDIGVLHHVPGFLPWHREMISRYEALLQETDPTVKLLYWDWTTDPENSTGGFNFFMSTFMGASGRGTGGVSIGLPFDPPLLPPTVTRNLGVSTTPPANPDATLLANGTYPPFRSNLELSPNHDSSHGYIGGGGNMSFLNAAAQDPFFFLLHGNADRLWAQWQRSTSALARLDPSTAYGADSAHATITNPLGLGPWSGVSGLRPWTVADGYIVNKTSKHPSIVTPPIYDTAPLVIPVLAPNQAVVIQIPWYPPNPADFACFGGDQAHMCLLARIETSTTPPFGMTFPEGADVYANTRNNNKIAWKNVTVNNFSGALLLASTLLRNVFSESVRAGLRFADTQEIGASFFDFGRIFVDLKPELFQRWRKGGSRGQGVEPVGKSTIQILSPEASIQNLRLEPNEVFPVDVSFQLFRDYRSPGGLLPKWDLIQIGSPADANAIVGGQRFMVDFNKLVLVNAGAAWRYLDNGTDPGRDWINPNFDDSQWKMGRAKLGFGSNPVTTIDGGPPNNRFITTYFRRAFDVDDLGLFQSLLLRLKRDDGAAVYLNGAEIYRVNLPPGGIAPDTLATRDVGGLESDMFFPISVPDALGLLQAGSNVIAVEIHLASPSSPDLGFDLELSANPVFTRFPPDVAFAAPVDGALFQTGQVISIEVEALDSDGRVTSVSLFADGNLIGTVDSPPYIFKWGDARPGPHRLRARAIDDDQQQATTDITISVLDNVPPLVELTQPAQHSVFQPGEAVRANAVVSSAVERVDFYLREGMEFIAPSRLVGTVATPPYTLDLVGLGPGHYEVTAVATDARGVTGEATPVHFEVAGK